ncbi:MAG: putative aminoacrylate hydrolase RutD [Pseudomonadales bacterium]|nr:putative aminoacrylate hydrolase RutD [Pseudomonadales bacterium]
MPTIAAHAPLRWVPVGPVRLATTDAGTGDAVLCIHGSWDDHRSWDAIANALRSEHRVVTYDRRGHSASSDVPGQGTILDDVSDAAALIRALELGPTHVVGHSYGACIAIVLATSHPELVTSLYLHEPPVFALLAEQHPDLLAASKAQLLRAAELLDAGEVEAGTVHFIEQVAFGDGSWSALFDEADRAIMLANADTWLDQSRDPQRLAVDIDRLACAPCPVTLSLGTATLPWFHEVTYAIARRVPKAAVELVPGGGHGSPKSHPLDIAEGFRTHIGRLAAPTQLS